MDAGFCTTCASVAGPLTRLPARELANSPSQPFHFFSLNELTWIDWVGVVGLILTSIGFGITWWQLHRTQTARQAVSQFITNFNRETAATRLTKTLTSLLALHNKVTDAVGKDDPTALRVALESWTQTCSRVIPQLRRTQTTPKQKHTLRRSHYETNQISENAKRFIAARVTVDEAVYKLLSSSRKRRLSMEVTHALSKIHECSNLAREILEENQYEKVS